MTSFNELSRQQLNDAAERFGVDVDNRWSSATLASKLIEAGVTIDQIQGAEEVLGVAESKTALDRFKADAEGDRLVVFMERPNQSFSIMGHKFTKDHPYVVMEADVAEMICDLAEGFRIADPREAAKFYKGV